MRSGVINGRIGKLVGLPAILPDLTVGAGEGGDVTHADHGGNEIRREGGRVGSVALDGGVGGATIKEHLVGVEEALLLDKVAEVLVVESGGSLKIKRCQIVVS